MRVWLLLYLCVGRVSSWSSWCEAVTRVQPQRIDAGVRQRQHEADVLFCTISHHKFNDVLNVRLVRGGNTSHAPAPAELTPTAHITQPACPASGCPRLPQLHQLSTLVQDGHARGRGATAVPRAVHGAYCCSAATVLPSSQMCTATTIVLCCFAAPVLQVLCSCCLGVWLSSESQAGYKPPAPQGCCCQYSL